MTDGRSENSRVSNNIGGFEGMALPEFLTQMMFEQIVMIILTVIIAVSVLLQAVATIKQARLLRESESRNNEREDRRDERDRQRDERDRKRENVDVRITLAGSLKNEYDDDSNLWKTKRFTGFIAANVSLFDVTITSCELETGIQLREDGSGIEKLLYIPEVSEYGGSALSDFAAPHRLRHGETLRVYFEEERLAESLKERGDEEPLRVRPCCYDSLGNKHVYDGWIVWLGDGKSISYDSPSPGYTAIP